MGRCGRYSAEFMHEAVAMVAAGKPVQEVAVRLGVAPGTLWHWVDMERTQAASSASANRQVVESHLRQSRLYCEPLDVGHQHIDVQCLAQLPGEHGPTVPPQLSDKAIARRPLCVLGCPSLQSPPRPVRVSAGLRASPD